MIKYILFENYFTANDNFSWNDYISLPTEIIEQCIIYKFFGHIKLCHKKWNDLLAIKTIKRFLKLTEQYGENWIYYSSTMDQE